MIRKLPVKSAQHDLHADDDKRISIMIIKHYYNLKPEDVVISRFFLFVFTYMLLLTHRLIRYGQHDGHE
jgi:hypothetical protein